MNACSAKQGPRAFQGQTAGLTHVPPGERGGPEPSVAQQVERAVGRARGNGEVLQDIVQRLGGDPSRDRAEVEAPLPSGLVRGVEALVQELERQAAVIEALRAVLLGG